MKAAKHDLFVSQGNDESWQLRLLDANRNPIGLTGATFRGGIKRNKKDTKLLSEFTFEILDPPSSGTFICRLDDIQTTQLEVKKLYYDIYITFGTITTRILEGRVTNSLGVDV